MTIPLTPRPGAKPAEPPRIRLMFSGYQPHEEMGVLITLSRVLGLDVWGNYLLGRRAAKEMGSAALLLLVVLVFELMAWTLLFNILIHSAQWEVSWRTLIALIMGAILSSGIFLFERSFITADFTESGGRKAFAYAIRLFIIAGSALATAQPIELLVFGGAIEIRLHEENVLAEAVRQVNDFKELEKKAQSKSEGQIQQELSDTLEARDLDSAKRERIGLMASSIDLKQQVARSRARLQFYSERVASAQHELITTRALRENASTEEERQNAEVRERAAQGKLALAQNRRAAFTIELASLEENLRSANTRLELLNAQVASSQNTFQELLERHRHRETASERVSEISLERLKEWMKIVRAAEPGVPIRRPETGRVLQPKPADFIDRLRVLEDLRQGRPPMWPNVSAEVREQAVQLFALEDPEGSNTQVSRMAQQRLNQNAELFRRIYYVAFIMACVIPLLTVAFKLMMAGELRDYYSTRAQARAGNPAALQIIRARGMRLRDLLPDSVNDGGSRSEAPDSQEI